MQVIRRLVPIVLAALLVSVGCGPDLFRPEPAPLVAILIGQTKTENRESVSHVVGLITESPAVFKVGSEVALFTLNGSTEPFFATRLDGPDDRAAFVEKLRTLDRTVDTIGTDPAAAIDVLSRWQQRFDPGRRLVVLIVSDLIADPVVVRGQKRPVRDAVDTDWSWVAARPGPVSVTAVAAAPHLATSIFEAWRPEVDLVLHDWSFRCKFSDLRLGATDGGL